MNSSEFHEFPPSLSHCDVMSTRERNAGSEHANGETFCERSPWRKVLCFVRSGENVKFVCVTRHTWDCSAIALLPTKCDHFAKRMNILCTVYHCLLLLPLLLGFNVLRLCITALVLHRSRVCARDLHSRPPTHRPGRETISVLCSQGSARTHARTHRVM